jgi:hypothetical protein
MTVEVINVRFSQLGDSEMSEMRNEMMVDETSRLTMRCRRPSRRRCLTPLLEEVGHRSRA